MTHTSLFVPGRNCARVCAAHRVAFLINGDAYFAALYDTLARAQRSILIVGWDVNSKVRLRRDGRSHDLPVELAPFLDTVLERNPDLHTHLLSWDFAMIYALEREPLPLYTLGWRTHQRLHFRLDSEHPVGASHHQKIVVVDDKVAFVGGIDLSKHRWDTSEHLPRDERRTDPDGQSYPPFHDVQMVVDGVAAAALGDLARERWRRSGGEAIAPPEGASGDPWPADVEPAVREVRVAIARTEPAHKGNPEVREVEALYLDAIAAARRQIYIENQYFTANVVAQALGRRLREADGPQIVMVFPKETPGWLEETTMGVLRARLLRVLRADDVHQRLHVYYPRVAGSDGNSNVQIHAKLMVVDDTLVRVGSANLSNRSMGLDTECDLALEAADQPALGTAIAALRSRLLAEHLGTTAAQVEQALSRHGSLAAAVESLRGAPRTLEPLVVEVSETWDRALPDGELIDPERPLSGDFLFQHLVPEELPGEAERGVGRARLYRLGAILAALLALGAAWRWTPLSDWLDPQAIANQVMAFGGSHFGPVVMIGTFVAGGLLMVPVTLLVLVTVLAFGPLDGFAYALVGSVLSAVTTFAIGHLLGRDTVRSLAGSKLNKLSRTLASRGVMAVFAVRMLPIAPFTVVNLVAGASHIRFRDFALGTVLGLTPGILAMTVFAKQVETTLRDPTLGSIATLVAVLLALAVAVWLIRGIVRRVRPRPPQDER